MPTLKVVFISAVVVAAALVSGYEFGLVRGEKRADARVHAALVQKDESDQLAVAKAYLDAMAQSNWNQFASSSTGYVWPSFILDRIHPEFDTLSGISSAKGHLKHISNVRCGPFLSRSFMESAVPLVLPTIPDRGQWPDWSRPPRAVFYDVGLTTYFVFVAWENGGWHAFGTPLVLKKKYLRHDDLLEAFSSDGVTGG